MDYEVSQFLTANNIIPVDIIFQIVEEFKKPENAYKRYMELLYETHPEYEKHIIGKLSSVMSIPEIDFDHDTKMIDLQLSNCILFEEALNYSCILLSKDEQGRIIIATDDPFHSERLDFVKSKTGRDYLIVLAAHSQIIQNLQLIYNRSIPQSRRPRPIIGTPFPSASRISSSQPSNTSYQQLSSTITDGEYHGKEVSDRYSIYPTNDDYSNSSIQITSNGLRHHNFDIQKSELLDLATQEPQRLPCEPFKTKGGLFNWFNAKVSGDEMNQFVADLNQVLIDSNSYSIKAFHALRGVYETFEALDKEYLASIYASIVSAEKAANDAKKASDKNDNAIKLIQQTIQKFTQFKSKITAINHIKEVDQIWDDVQVLNTQMSDMQKRLIEIQHTIEQNKAQIDSQIQSFSHEAAQIKHSIETDSITHNTETTAVIKKRSTIACILSGVALFVVFLHFLLDIIGVL